MKARRPSAADRGRRFVRFGSRSVVDQRDVDARFRQRQRDDRANALAAGDERDFAVSEQSGQRLSDQT